MNFEQDAASKQTVKTWVLLNFVDSDTRKLLLYNLILENFSSKVRVSYTLSRLWKHKIIAKHDNAEQVSTSEC